HRPQPPEADQRGTSGQRHSVLVDQAHGSPRGKGRYTGSASTGFVRAPIDSISIVTVSPGWSQRCGRIAIPTPCGVPVRMTVPGASVVLPLRNSMRVGTSKIMSEVVQSCTFSPLRVVLIARSFGSGISSVVTRRGPRGAKVSNIFPRHHWLPPFLICQSRAETSFAQVYPS